jgi:hypothetical protein
MNDQHHHQSHFDNAFSQYYRVLKNNYLEGVNTSFNKEYAADYFRTILFEENSAIPIVTVFFDELRTFYNHLYNLHGDTATARITGYLDRIRKKSREALERIERFCDGFGGTDFLELPVYYEVQIDKGVIPTDIIEQEKSALALSDQEVIELLALYAVTEKLKTEFQSGLL